MPISFDRNVLTESFGQFFFLEPHFASGGGLVGWGGWAVGRLGRGVGGWAGWLAGGLSGSGPLRLLKFWDWSWRAGLGWLGAEGSPETEIGFGLGWVGGCWTALGWGMGWAGGWRLGWGFGWAGLGCGGGLGAGAGGWGVGGWAGLGWAGWAGWALRGSPETIRKWQKCVWTENMRFRMANSNKQFLFIASWRV